MYNNSIGKIESCKSICPMGWGYPLLRLGPRPKCQSEQTLYSTEVPKKKKKEWHFVANNGGDKYDALTLSNRESCERIADSVKEQEKKFLTV